MTARGPKSGLTLLERILLSEAQNPPKPKRVRPADKWERIAQTNSQTADDSDTKLIPLQVWAESTFGDDRPNHHTVRRWAETGKIFPLPVKIERNYFCSSRATYSRAGEGNMTTKNEPRAQIESARAPHVSQKDNKGASRKKGPKLVPVSVWAVEVFGEHAPHPNTLRRWIQNAKIVPYPVLVGRRYFCSPDARYFDPVAEKINRMAAL